MMNFGEALAYIKNRTAVRRVKWLENTWVSLRDKNAVQRHQRPFVYLRDGEGFDVPWVPSQEDILAEDWEVCNFG